MRQRVPAALVIAALLAAGSAAQVLDFYDPAAYRTIELQFNQTNYWTQLTSNYVSEVEIPADMTVDGVVYPNVGVRFRGNTSYTQLPAGSQKKSFNIKLDTFTPGQEIQGYDHLNLNNGFHDPTFLREFLSYWVMRRYGPAPGCNFVKLFINGVYWGVYVNVQQPNKDMMRQWYRTDDGNRYRCFPTSGSFSNGQCAYTYLGSNVASYLASYQAKLGDGTDLMSMCNILNNSTGTGAQTAINNIFSVDSFYRYAAVMNALTNTDSYLGSGKDHYLYHDNVYGQFHTFPFDLNEALAGSTSLSMWYNTTLATRPGFSKTLTYADWNQRYIAHFRTILEDTLDWTNVLGPLATQYHAMIQPDVLTDTKKIYTYQQFLDNLTLPVTVSGGGIGPGGGSTTIPGLQPLVTGRRTYLLSQAEFSTVRATLAGLQHAPLAPTPAQTVTFTVQATLAATVSLWWHATGGFVQAAMFDDGLHGDGAVADGVYGVVLGPFPAGKVIEYYASAANGVGRLSFLPKTAEHASPFFQVGWPQGVSPIRINEFVAQNTNVITDPAGSFEDYVELYNDSNATVVVGGLYLSDNPINPTKFQIPAGTTIAANATLLIWCDEDGSEGPLHANFKLATAGESVALFAADGVTQLDWIEFGQQTANVATARLIDGRSPWVTIAPTPGALNRSAACGVRSYDALDPTVHTMSLTVAGTPAPGSTFALIATGAHIGGAGYLLAGLAGANDSVLPYTTRLLVDPSTLGLFAMPIDPAGIIAPSVTVAPNPGIVGLSIYVQAASTDGVTVAGSNAVEITFCP